MQGGRGWFTRPYSSADSVVSVVPDSQSPEPIERPSKRRKESDEQFLVPRLPQSSSHRHRPSAPSPFSNASSSTFKQLSVRSPVKAEVKEERYWSEENPSYGASSTSSRAKAPSPDDKARIKREIRAELAEEDERALLYRSRVNSARDRPDRRKERAPSLEMRVKQEEPVLNDDSFSFLSTEGGDSRATSAAPYFLDDERGVSATPSGAGTSRSTLFLEEEQARDDYDTDRAGPAPRRHVQRDYSSSGEDEQEDRSQGAVSSDSDDYQPSELTEGTPRPVDDADDASTVASDEGASAKSRNGMMRRQPKKRKKMRQRAKTKKEVEADALNFLEGIDLPAPKYRPLDVKARLANELAKETAVFPRQSRVDPVDMPAPQLQSDTADDAVEDDEDRLTRSASHGASGVLRSEEEVQLTQGEDARRHREASPADSLEEYVDEQDDPETVFQPKFENIDLVQIQAYFDQPTREGAVNRWIALLEKDSEPLPPAFSYPTVISDCASLELLGIAVAHDVVLSRDFQDDSAEVLISTRPSMAVCTLLWRDLTDANHDERHQAAAGAGRRCCCPLWMPSNRREWDEELEVLESLYGIGLRELAEVLDVAFPRSDTGISISDGNSLELVYNHNWLWYSQIVQLALTRRAYSVVTSRAVLDALFKYQTVRRDLFHHERRKLQRRRDQEVQAARERGRLPDIEFHQDLLAFEVKAEEELENLASLRKRLDSTRKADADARGGDDDDDAVSIASVATYGSLRPSGTTVDVDDWREKRFDPPPLKTPQGWDLVEAYRARDRAAAGQA